MTWVGLIVLAGLLCLSVAGLQPAASAPPEKVRICHRTASENNPYTSNEPAIGNNGELQGGHLGHTGPVFPQKGPDKKWGDIIPPYEYIDKNGETQVYPGQNWSPEGQAIWENGCGPALDPLTPILDCVQTPRGGGFLAHFGYNNPNDAPIVEPSDNAFTPPPEDRDQPTTFQPGTVHDAFQAASTGAPLTWSLTGNTVTATRDSPHCQGSITIVKVLNPSKDSGRFNLEIGRNTAGGAAAVGDGGTTGTVAVKTGRHTVGESAAQGTSLADYDTLIECVNGSGDIIAESASPTVRVTVRKNANVLCTITNTREDQLKPLVPTLDCVVFKNGAPDTAVWGYHNENGFAVTVPIGAANGFAPAPQDRGQPQMFEAGTWPGEVQTAFTGSPTVAWTLAGQTLTASASSPPCTATLELKKVTVPANDPGVFNLLVNGQVRATGGNGTTTGTITVGVGEGTVSETAGAGTTLTNYETTIDCTRNGTHVLSVTGTKVDGEIAQGDAVVCTFTNRRLSTPATMELRKVTVPANDPGVFNLRVNGQVLASGGNGTTTGPKPVGVGEATVSETAAPGTTLTDYETTIECTRNGTPGSSGTGTQLNVGIAEGAMVVCTFTNRHVTTPPIPPIPPTPDTEVDLAVQKSATPTTVSIGHKITWTVKVTNDSSVDANDVNVVKVSDRAYRTKLISLTPSQGTCTTAPAACNLGRIAAGASATITAVTRATQIGVIPNVVRVGSEEQETDYKNNVAGAVVRVVGPLKPPARGFCRTLVAAPRLLRQRTSSMVLATATDRFGTTVPGLTVLMRGAGIDQRAITNARGIARFAVTPSRRGIVFFTSRFRATAALGARCTTFLGVLAAKAGFVTG